MKRKHQRFTSSPFPDLVLHEIAIDQIREIAHELTSNCVLDYERYLRRNRMVDSSRWELTKQKNDLLLFVERNDGEDEDDCGAIPILDTRNNPFDSAYQSDNLPGMLCTGTITGNLDDCMFGILSPTLRDMALRASYVNDLQRGAVLATLVDPTTADPFHSLTLKWMEIDLPLHETKLVKNRDFVYLEATGTTTLQNGERVGYFLAHSIQFPQTCELDGRIRGNISFCAVFRQVQSHSLEIYCTGVAAPGGKLPDWFWRRFAMDPALLLTRYVYCGQMKKLSFLLHNAYEDAMEKQDDVVGGVKPLPQCCTCDRDLSKGFFRSVGRSTSRCTVCAECVCRRCALRKTVSFFTRDERVVQRKLSFCGKCVHKANKLSAVDAARDQIAVYENENDRYSNMFSFNTNTSTELFRTLRL